MSYLTRFVSCYSRVGLCCVILYSYCLVLCHVVVVLFRVVTHVVSYTRSKCLGKDSQISELELKIYSK